MNKKKKNHKSKQPINLDLMNIDEIVISDKLKYSDDGKYVNILLVTKKVRLLNLYVLSNLKWMDTWNNLKIVAKNNFND